MKTPLISSLLLATFGALFACSSDEGSATRDPVGGTPTGAGGAANPVAAGGAPATGNPTTPAATGGAPLGAGGAPAVSAYRAGPALVITPTATGANVADEDGTSGITGGVILAQSTLQQQAVVAHEDGKLCVSGETAVVLNDDYTTYWGAELALDLLLAPDPAAPAAAADAGGGTLVRQPWPVGDVVGFSYVLTGNGEAGAGVPPGAQDVRFKVLPEGSDPALDTFCNQGPRTSGAVVETPLTDVTWRCWDMGNPSVAEPNINTVTVADAAPTQRPNPGRLLSISWQVSANINATTPFNFCVSDIKPLYAQ